MIRGFRFGMILQLAIGPICIYIFQVATSQGFLIAEMGVLATALTDGLEIILAMIGVGVIIERHHSAKVVLKIGGAIVLLVYGVGSILSAFHLKLIPSFAATGSEYTGAVDVFLRAILLALSNPLAVVFWSGIFAAKIAKENMGRRDLYRFGLGCVLATLLFLSIISFSGSVTKQFVSTSVVQILNAGVGLLLIYYGLRSMLAKS